MPDEDEREIDGVDGALVADILLVETLMGWDGDRCECPDCVCTRFRDGEDGALCPECRVGDHS